MAKAQTLRLRALTPGTIYKLAAIGSCFTLLPFSILMGAFALFGAQTVHWNHHSLTGITGLLAAPFIGVFICVVFTTVFGSVLALGLWLFSKWRPVVLKARPL